MKGIKLLLAVLLAPLAFQAAADDAPDVSRAATRRPTIQNNTNQSRTKAASISQKKNTISRGTTTERIETVDRSQSTTRTRGDVVSARSTTNANRNISTRSATPPLPRATTVAQRAPQQQTRTTTRTPHKDARTTTAARSGTTPARSATNSDILSRDFSKCRTVFYDCMDEFCANKDNQLKRCACSSRINEFNSTKKNLTNVEERLMDFSQRLLTVNMEKEDAAALYQATEGELAFSEQDKSQSKKMLDEIAKKLNTSFDDSNFNQSLNAISLSLNTDAAFDTIDSMAGASTTTKSGTALYSAALPVCREMAAEVCSPTDLEIAESGYQMAIETDCNTVKKSYQTQIDQAREHVFESGALLDMSRLDIHQKRNSDDILTCRRKMLDMLTDSAVCGDAMGKCLDTTGRYIDPTTGTAFLTTDLANLSSLITRPDANQTWRTAPGNERFITFLNSKKKFLEPAMEQCQDISDYVWDEFIEDALAQIKLAQESKLEEVRQSCTTLTTQCMDDAYDSISEFDARALSIFGVAADKTVNAMCSDVQNACSALLQTTGGASDWQTGITEIATDKTYETILQTCREVGRACIIQACTSVSGNFGLCENIDTSINRKSIINRTACWDEVVACVASAGTDSLTQIQKLHPLDNFNSFYQELYSIDTSDYIISGTTDSNTTDCITSDGTVCVHDICTEECANATEQFPVPDTCYTCRLAERIWGNCEAPSKTTLAVSNTEKEYHNKIRTGDNNGNPIDTLLSWFAKNTGTANTPDSCRDTSCPPNFIENNGKCLPASHFDSTGEFCTGDKISITDNETSQLTNCCTDGKILENGKCCLGNDTTVTLETYFGTKPENKLCTKTNLSLVVNYGNGQIYCNGTIDWTNGTNTTEDYPNGQTVTCKGTLIQIDDANHYTSPSGAVWSYYKTQDKITCYYDTIRQQWTTCDDKTDVCEQNPTNWLISYEDVCGQDT